MSSITLDHPSSNTHSTSLSGGDRGGGQTSLFLFKGGILPDRNSATTSTLMSMIGSRYKKHILNFCNLLPPFAICRHYIKIIIVMPAENVNGEHHTPHLLWRHPCLFVVCLFNFQPFPSLSLCHTTDGCVGGIFNLCPSKIHRCFLFFPLFSYVFFC